MGFKIQELEEFFDLKYSDDRDKVTFKDWLYFHNIQDSRDLEEKVKTLNVPYMGYWFTLKKSRDAVILLEALSVLFTNIEGSILETVRAQGVRSQYFTDFNTFNAQTMVPIGISLDRAHFLWEDPAFGFERGDMNYWVVAAGSSFTLSSQFSKEALNLQDYFNLSPDELFLLLTTIKGYTDTIQNLIINNHYCYNLPKCEGRELAIRQLAQAYVTRLTPNVSSIVQNDSICLNPYNTSSDFPYPGNITC
jgi:hypothetical protein